MVLEDNNATDAKLTKSEVSKNNRIEPTEWCVLVVDDVADNLSVVQAVLEFHGAEVHSAHNGIEGLQLVETLKPNLILLDLSMPGMDGWEMLQHLQENPLTASISVIALTANAMEGVKAKVVEAGFAGYIVKPFSVMTLIDDIKKMIQSSLNSAENN